MHSLVPPFIKMSAANHQTQAKTISAGMGYLKAQSVMFLKGIHST